MKRSFLFFILSCVLLTSCDFMQKHLFDEFDSLEGKQQEEHHTHPLVPLHKSKKELLRYEESGDYKEQFDKATHLAKRYISSRMRDTSTKAFAITLDIDETALSNMEWIKEALLNTPLDEDFAPPSMREWQKQGLCEAFFSTLEIYRLAQDHNIKVFFITERPESMREITELNLLKQGYTQKHELIMLPDVAVHQHHNRLAQFKSQARRDIVNQGFTILLNMGDQQSDLTGGYVDHSIKLPNPFYFLP